MTGVLEEFRAQRRLVQEVHARLTDVGGLLRTLQEEASKLAHADELRALLQEEQTWLTRAEALITEVRTLRDLQIARPGAAWRRWLGAIVFGLAAAAASGAGYVWAAAPYAAQLANLRERVESLDVIVQHMATMTPAERRQFDALMTRSPPEPKSGR